MLSIIKRLNIILLPKDEFVFKKNELASEMYFIIEGEAGVLDAEDKPPIAILKKSNYFGEMGIINGKANLRTVKKYFIFK